MKPEVNLKENPKYVGRSAHIYTTIITSFLPGVESGDQCLLNCGIFSGFYGFIMSIRLFFYSTMTFNKLCYLLELVF